ncbi:PREDICTED: uncharacterized protein LOC104600208 [Nelumbo nucifera]|uniref:Uncharacterized protein LOC104600208 n=2 Tax=Nelumbo nucifera TaxID=4432 RepID=A0A1U8A2T0_NELNU|nr:PREDICTED: uncharacterized protein LOC104600208 [Nelumbo nucifera]DAD35134.1 TPA_asm: hypothetical protein HUJ06_005774 [Nelumbo nucifera]
MALTMFTRSVVGLLLTVLAQRVSVAQNHQAMRTEVVVGANGLAESELSKVSVDRELFDGVPAETNARSNRLGGRKVAAGSVLMMGKESSEGKSPKISGGDENVYSKKSIGTLLPRKMSDKNDRSMPKPKPKALNSDSKEIQGSGPIKLPYSATCSQFMRPQGSDAISTCDSLKCSSRSRRLLGILEFHNPFEKSENQQLLEATNEMVNLLHKDYRASPRRKPPINNNVPLKP